ncbi:hypothetical protein ACI65C_009095 [Semiaphis heraclei]
MKKASSNWSNDDLETEPATDSVIKPFSTEIPIALDEHQNLNSHYQINVENADSSLNTSSPELSCNVINNKPIDINSNLDSNTHINSKEESLEEIKKPDCFILTSAGEIVQIIEILSNSSVIVGKSFNSKSDMFEKPIKSSKLDIYVVNNLSENSMQWRISDIKKKIMIFNMDGKLLALPILK